MKEKSYWVYILSNHWKVIYIGVTNNLERRLFEHKTKLKSRKFFCSIFYKSFGLFEEANDVLEAIKREKQLKHYKREWKVKLIEKENPEWKNLSGGWF